jgi:hypothetical protein
MRRRLRKTEQEQRGCQYCMYMLPPRFKNENRRCPYKECPYHELDNVKTYGEYLKKSGSINIAKLLNLQGRKG